MQLPDPLSGALKFNDQGLIPAIAQQHDSGEVLMMAWMNAAAIGETLETGQVCYWSRSRQAMWRKGEQSGQRQRLIEMRLDCDGDTLLLLVDQLGVACHTGRRSCFYLETDASGTLEEKLPVLVRPEDLYGGKG
ncbi:MAG: phosphoribosyl-AMP cyclohydrolase [Pseudomonadota bacterium]